MKKICRYGAMALLSIVFVWGVVMMARQAVGYQQSEALYDDARQLAFSAAGKDEEPATTVPETTAAQETTPAEEPDAGAVTVVQPQQLTPEPVQQLQKTDLAALKQVNPDVLGWIYIPDTIISYPLMKTTDRDSYLHLAWDGTPNENGSIFLEKSNRRDFSDFNTIIYGHLMADGSMFGSLKNYQTMEYGEEHPYVYIATAAGVYRYQIFAAYEAPVQSDTYRLYFEEDTHRQAALEHYLHSSVLDTGIVPQVTDRILTLSTCMGTGRYETRWVVQAVLTGFWPA